MSTTQVNTHSPVPSENLSLQLQNIDKKNAHQTSELMSILSVLATALSQTTASQPSEASQDQENGADIGNGKAKQSNPEVAPEPTQKPTATSSSPSFVSLADVLKNTTALSGSSPEEGVPSIWESQTEESNLAFILALLSLLNIHNAGFQAEAQNEIGSASNEIASYNLQEAQQNSGDVGNESTMHKALQGLEDVLELTIAAAATCLGCPELGAVILVMMVASMTGLTNDIIGWGTDMFEAMGVPPDVAKALSATCFVLATVALTGGIAAGASALTATADVATAGADLASTATDLGEEGTEMVEMGGDASEAAPKEGTATQDSAADSKKNSKNPFKKLSKTTNLAMVAGSKALLQSNALVDWAQCLPDGQLKTTVVALAAILEIGLSVGINLGSSFALVSNVPKGRSLTMVQAALTTQEGAQLLKGVTGLALAENDLNLSYHGKNLRIEQTNVSAAQALAAESNQMTAENMKVADNGITASMQALNQLVIGFNRQSEMLAQMFSGSKA